MSFLKQTIENYDQNTFNSQPVLEYFEKKYSNIGTRMTKLSAFKKELLLKTIVPGFKSGYEYNISMRKSGENPVLLPKHLTKLVLSKSITKKINKKRNENLEKKMKELVNINQSKKFRKIILKGLKSDNTKELFPALLLASGRRTNELYRLETDFQRVVGERNMALFTGQSKNSDIGPYEIPLLVRYSTFKKAWNKWRELIKNDISNDAKEIHKNTHKRHEQIFIEINRNYFNHYYNFTPHLMRNLYIAYSYKDDNQGMPITGFAKTFLGHGDLYSQMHYTNIILN